MPDELSPREVAEHLGTSPRSVQRWIASGRLPARRVGGRWRVAFGALGAFAQPETSAVEAAGLPTSVRTVFIANRGEIARRITRTCDRLGIRAVIPVTDGPNGLDLLDPAAVVAAALASGADAVHPGFGFLAENGAFAKRVEAVGIRWVGPPPSTILAMGDKAAARRLAASLGIPVLPGYDGPGQGDRVLARASDGIGFPLIVKPAAGGGGKGMRTVREPGRLPEALAAARREAMAAFGDDRLILERLLEGARHIEIQVLFDADGHGVHLGERDCSIQRRHQKVLEESPSPAVDADLRHRLGVAALRLARRVGYVNAGTCEFLVDDRGDPAFLEMNTRLQVEHPVTELVTGRDLVADQLRIAAGERLGFDSETVHPIGHAVEVRLYAEDAEAGFLPATGRVERLRWPSGEGIRVDAGIDPGTDIGDRFDPMLAKIVAWGPDRATAFERLAGALDATVVLGVITNLRFLRWLVRQPVVLAGEARTDTLDRIWPPDGWSARAEIPDGAWRMAAASLAAVGEPADPWAGGWRLNAAPTLALAAEGLVRSVPLDPAPTLPGGADAFEAVLAGHTVHVDVAGRSTAFRIAPPPDVDATARAAAAHGHASAGGPVELLAPMPGAVLRVHVPVGGLVTAGDPVVTLEAMKMEHVVVTSIAGRIADIRVRAADQVTRGQLLAVVEP